MERKQDYLPEFEPPKKKLHNDHAEQIKTLYKSQQNVSLDLQKELLKPNIFVKSSEEISFSPYESGTFTLKQIKVTDEKINKINEFKRMGLLQNDIELYFNYIEHGMEYVKSKYSNHEPELLNNKIKDLLNMINIQDNIEVNEKNTSNIHPMQYIKELANNFDKNKEPIVPINIKKIRRKARKLNSNIQSQSTHETNIVASSSTDQEKFTSQWDITETPRDNKNNANHVSKIYTCQKQNYYTIKEGNIIKLDHIEDQKKLDRMFHVNGKMSLEDILKIPKFSNYQAGVPSNILYVKNLPKKMTTNDLKAIFKDTSALEFKLLEGKMHGQAFITYETINAATNSLQTLNGVIINDKPVILQYAKSNKTS